MARFNKKQPKSEYSEQEKSIHQGDQHSSTNGNVVDAFGNVLVHGDAVQLTRELKVKGTNVALKKGTQVKRVRLTDNLEEVECNIVGIKGVTVLRTEFLKKK